MLCLHADTVFGPETQDTLLYLIMFCFKSKVQATNNHRSSQSSRAQECLKYHIFLLVILSLQLLSGQYSL